MGWIGRRVGPVVIAGGLVLLGMRLLIYAREPGTLSRVLVVGVGTLAVLAGAAIGLRHRLAVRAYLVWVLLYLGTCLAFEFLVISRPLLGMTALLFFILPLLLVVGLYLQVTLRPLPEVVVLPPPRPRSIPVSENALPAPTSRKAPPEV